MDNIIGNFAVILLKTRDAKRFADYWIPGILILATLRTLIQLKLYLSHNYHKFEKFALFSF